MNPFTPIADKIDLLDRRVWGTTPEAALCPINDPRTPQFVQRAAGCSETLDG